MGKKSKAKLQKLIEKRRYYEQLESASLAKEPIQSNAATAKQDNSINHTSPSLEVKKTTELSLEDSEKNDLLVYQPLKDIKRTIISVALITLILGVTTVYYFRKPTLKNWSNQIYRFLELEGS